MATRIKDLEKKVSSSIPNLDDAKDTGQNLHAACLSRLLREGIPNGMSTKDLDDYLKLLEENFDRQLINESRRDVEKAKKRRQRRQTPLIYRRHRSPPIKTTAL